MHRCSRFVSSLAFVHRCSRSYHAVLPDISHWGQPYLHVKFDSEPVVDSDLPEESALGELKTWISGGLMGIGWQRTTLTSKTLGTRVSACIAVDYISICVV